MNIQSLLFHNFLEYFQAKTLASLRTTAPVLMEAWPLCYVVMPLKSGMGFKFFLFILAFTLSHELLGEKFCLTIPHPEDDL